MSYYYLVQVVRSVCVMMRHSDCCRDLKPENILLDDNGECPLLNIVVLVNFSQDFPVVELCNSAG